MSVDRSVPEFLWRLLTQLRRRQFPLGPDDFEALWLALRAGFGWASHDDLCELCCALWANSPREKEIIEALFEQTDETPTWELPELGHLPRDRRSPTRFQSEGVEPREENEKSDLPPAPAEQLDVMPAPPEVAGLPPIPKADLLDRSFVFAPLFPLTERETAQIWRRLRRPVREGPCIELDIEATIERRCQRAVVSDVVLVPRKRNIVRLLMLVDRQGSMRPFHAFVSQMCDAIQQFSTIENLMVYYFHNVPAESESDAVLSDLSNDN